MTIINILSFVDLKDYLRSMEGIQTMFDRLGYDVYDPETLDIEDLEL